MRGNNLRVYTKGLGFLLFFGSTDQRGGLRTMRSLAGQTLAKAIKLGDFFRFDQALDKVIRTYVGDLGTP